MVKLRLLALGVASTAILVTTASAASAAAAADQANGQGKTHLGATLGFVAHKDLRGNLVYRSADGSFSAKCHGYTSFQRRAPFDPAMAGQVLKVRVTATCMDADGRTVYLKAKFADHGEPGTKDIARIFWSYTNPNASQAPALSDVGVIQNGNIQVFYR
jgi:hypothetical protein